MSTSIHFGPSRRANPGFTVPEMLAVIAIIIIVMSILLPSLSNSRESAKSAQCANNQHHLGLAFRALMAEQKGKTPNVTQLLNGLTPYLSADSITAYNCPKVKFVTSNSYGANPCVHRMQGEGGKIIMLDAFVKVILYEGGTSQEWIDSVSPRHFGTSMNVLYYDGHVELKQPEQINPYASAQNLTSLWKPTKVCDLAEAGCGVTGTYYTGNFGGTTVTRIDPSVHLPFGAAFFGYNFWNIPLPGSLTSGWNTGSFGSGVWKAQIKSDYTEPYTFHLACDNDAWLYINGSQVIQRFAGNAGGCTGCVDTYQASSSVSMTAGQWVDIEVRLKETTPGSSPSHVSVKWESGSTPLAPIPCSNLRPR